MKAMRTKYKRTTPKTTVEYSTWNLELNASLVDLIVNIIKRIFGLHYMHMTHSYTYSAV